MRDPVQADQLIKKMKFSSLYFIFSMIIIWSLNLNILKKIALLIRNKNYADFEGLKSLT